MMRAALILVLAVVGISRPTFAACIGLNQRVGGWEVCKSSVYKGCVATARYRSGIRVVYGYDGISKERFIAFQGAQIWARHEDNAPLRLRLDFRPRRFGSYTVEARLRSRSGLGSFEIGNLTEEFLDVLSAASRLYVWRNDFRVGGFRLSKTRRAIRVVRSCQGW